MKFGFISLGCVKNRVDTERIMGIIRDSKYEIVSNPKEADCIIINTCGFIEPAKEEAIQTILEIASLKEENLQKLIVTGCLVERYYEDLILELPEVDLFVRIQDYSKFPMFFEDALQIPFHGNYYSSSRYLSTNPWMAYLKIAEGCSNRCHYCAIPLIRGPYKSYPLVNLIGEARELADKGVKELVVIAQDTTRYGEDLYGKRRLLDLLEALNQIEELHWIRVLYMYPDEIDETLIDGMKKLEKVLPYFDIPMQHGSNRLLQAMNRRGSIEDITKMIQYIRKVYPYSVLRTTMIVGYPGETEADFKQLLSFVEEIKWDRLGAFTYSKEEDTVAYSLSNEVDSEIQNERYGTLMRCQQEVSEENNQQLIGKELEVVIESYDGLKACYRGRSVYNAPDGIDGLVYVYSNEKIAFGTFVQVSITKANQYDLFGEYNA